MSLLHYFSPSPRKKAKGRLSAKKQKQNGKNKTPIKGQQALGFGISYYKKDGKHSLPSPAVLVEKHRLPLTENSNVRTKSNGMTKEHYTAPSTSLVLSNQEKIVTSSPSVSNLNKNDVSMKISSANTSHVSDLQNSQQNRSLRKRKQLKYPSDDESQVETSANFLPQNDKDESTDEDAPLEDICTTQRKRKKRRKRVDLSDDEAGNENMTPKNAQKSPNVLNDSDRKNKTICESAENVPLDAFNLGAPPAVSENALVGRNAPSSQILNTEQTTVGTNNFSVRSWIRPDKIKDITGRRPNDPDYDQRTLWIPPGGLKSCTPAEKQYWKIKQHNFDVILFFKIGKFYEIFDDDAHICVRELNLSYMKNRSRPHAGFPEKAYEKYAEQLVQLGYRVGRVEQMETPKQLAERNKINGTKEKAVRREMCQVMTRGTLVDGEMLDGDSASYMLSFCENKSGIEYGICFVDTTTANFHIGQFSDDRQRTHLRTLLAQIRPEELVFPRNGLSSITQRILREECPVTVLKTALTPVTEFWGFEKTVDQLNSQNYFNCTETNTGFKDEKNGWPSVLSKVMESKKQLLMSAVGGCVSYLQRILLDKELMSGAIFHHYDPSNQFQSEYLVLDGQTLQNLEILTNANGDTKGTLLKHLDHCVTTFGKRMLKTWVVRPLGRIEAIDDRLNAVETFMKNPELLQNVRNRLKLPDLERMITRIHAHGIPKENDREAVMYSNINAKRIRQFLKVLQAFDLALTIPSEFEPFLSDISSERLAYIVTLGKGFPNLFKELQFFKDAFDHQEAEKEGFIAPKKGYEPEYDQVEKNINDMQKKLDDHLQKQKKYFKSSKIKYTHRGKERYQIEIPVDCLHKVQPPDHFQEMSSTKSRKRFWTPLIEEILPQLNDAEDTFKQFQKNMTCRMFSKFCHHYQSWMQIIAILGELDCLISLALTSQYQEGKSCRPKFVSPSESDGAFLELRDAIHPSLIGTTEFGTFIPNDTVLGCKENIPKFVLVSGPNMGGKSTLLRQTCAAVIMAQVGAYVPASKCRLTPVDRIFTRVGANDRIMQGQSTFLVELEETANILRHATNHSLVILDELGRGTSTFDGTAIAYSVIKFLSEQTSCLTLFSTHYHMLMEEFSQDSGISMYHMSCNVEDNNQDVTFLYKFEKGTCAKSFGMNVANLAGLSLAVIKRAREMSDLFETRLENAHKIWNSREKICTRIHKALKSESVNIDELKKLLVLAKATM